MVFTSAPTNTTDPDPGDPFINPFGPINYINYLDQNIIVVNDDILFASGNSRIAELPGGHAGPGGTRRFQPGRRLLQVELFKPAERNLARMGRGQGSPSPGDITGGGTTFTPKTGSSTPRPPD